MYASDTWPGQRLLFKVKNKYADNSVDISSNLQGKQAHPTEEQSKTPLFHCYNSYNVYIYITCQNEQCSSHLPV